MSIARSLIVHNGHAFSLADCPLLPIEQFRQEVVEGIAAGGRLSAFFAYPGESGALRLLAAVARAERRQSGGRLGRCRSAICGHHARLSASPPLRTRNLRAMECAAAGSSLAEAGPLSATPLSLREEGLPEGGGRFPGRAGGRSCGAA